MEANPRRDVAVILAISAVSAVLYIACEGPLMEYGRDASQPLLLRFLPVLLIQFGMSCLGVLVVLVRNRERLAEHGLVERRALASIAGCLLAAVPTVALVWLTDGIDGFLPFQGMFLTRDILAAPFPLNLLGYAVVALVWGFGEGLFYVVLTDKINAARKPRGLLNMGALACAAIAVLIHGMVGFDVRTLLEAVATVILMYGSLMVYERTGNAWGIIAVFFFVWNAL